MKLTINPILDLETLTWVSNDGTYDYDGPVVHLGGPSGASKHNAAMQAAFYDQMTKQQATAFAEQQDILATLKSIAMPVYEKGMNQYGFSPEEDALLRSEITDQAAEGTAHTIEAQELRERQRSGGAPILPGGQEQIEATIRTLGEQGKARALSGERLAGYQVGRENFRTAAGILSGSAGMLSPTSYAGAATGAGEGATGAIKLMDSERSHLLGDILKGAIGAGTSFLTGGASNFFGGGGGGGGGSSPVSGAGAPGGGYWS